MNGTVGVGLAAWISYMFGKCCTPNVVIVNGGAVPTGQARHAEHRQQSKYRANYGVSEVHSAQARAPTRRAKAQ